MTVFHKRSFVHGLGKWLLAILLLSAFMPALHRNDGHFTELCTTEGFKLAWVADTSSAASDPNGSAYNTNHHPHCAWCLTVLPTLLAYTAFTISHHLRHTKPNDSKPSLIARMRVWLPFHSRAPPSVLQS